MLEIPYLENMVFERSFFFVDLFSMAFGLPGFSISNDIVGGQHQMRERNQAKKACNRRINKNIGQVKPLKGDFWLIGFVDCAETARRGAVNWPKRFQAIWKNFWGCKAPLGLLEGINNPPSVQTLPSGKLTWQWKITLLKTYSLLKMVIFHCYVSLPDGNL